MEMDTLRVALQQAMDDEDIARYELTVIRGRGSETLAEVVKRTRLLHGYSKVRVSTVSRLADAGYGLVDCDSKGHCQIVFDESRTIRCCRTSSERSTIPNPTRATGEGSNDTHVHSVATRGNR